ncbi:hypothetical protein [Deinococcus psychrotolerans]|uniref:hypothetical protein n=1 Tax=Deinococcus psychrotolerans TaxID=2489213 RepID=UPI0013DDDFDE|nr:hypothetical protein [Deinococcus psychrotolerans]
MTDFLILVFLIGAPAWLTFQFVKARPVIESKGRFSDPLTGAFSPVPETCPQRFK